MPGRKGIRSSAQSTFLRGETTGRYRISEDQKAYIAKALRSGDTESAVRLANLWIWEPFNRDDKGNPIPWLPLASNQRIAETLAIRPKILSSVAEQVLGALKFAAVMAELLGPAYRYSEWISSDLETGLAMETKCAVSMIGMAVNSASNMRAWRHAGCQILRRTRP